MEKIIITKREIKSILSFLEPAKGIPKEIALSLYNKQYESFSNQLFGLKIYPHLIPKLIERFISKYHESMVSPGTNVGIIQAQALSQVYTQAKLNSFHTAGSDSNIPHKVDQILSATESQKDKRMVIYFKKDTSDIETLMNSIGNTIVEITLWKLMGESYENIEYCVLCNKREPWQDIYDILYDRAYSTCTSYVKITIDKSFIYKYKITLESIAKKIESTNENFHCIFSPDEIGQIRIYINIASDKYEKKLDKKKTIISEDDKSYLNDITFGKLKTKILFGIEGIKNIYFTPDDRHDKEIKRCWMVNSYGANLDRIFSHPLVDFTRTQSTYLWDIYHLLGIEALRTYILTEYNITMPSLSTAHTMLLADFMTYSGRPTAISRFTMKDLNVGPINKIGFEWVLTMIENAGAYGEHDKIIGSTSSVMNGAHIKEGTGAFSLMASLS